MLFPLGDLSEQDRLNNRSESEAAFEDWLSRKTPDRAPASYFMLEPAPTARPAVREWELQDPYDKRYTFRGTHAELSREVSRLRRYRDQSDPNLAVLRTPGKPVPSAAPPRKVTSTESGRNAVPSPKVAKTGGK